LNPSSHGIGCGPDRLEGNFEGPFGFLQGIAGNLIFPAIAEDHSSTFSLNSDEFLKPSLIFFA